MATLESDSSFQCYFASLWFAGLPWKRKLLGGRTCALDGVIASWQKAATDPAAAQADLDADGQTPETKRLEESSTAVGLDACNG